MSFPRLIPLHRYPHARIHASAGSQLLHFQRVHCFTDDFHNILRKFAERSASSTVQLTPVTTYASRYVPHPTLSMEPAPSYASPVTPIPTACLP